MQTRAYQRGLATLSSAGQRHVRTGLLDAPNGALARAGWGIAVLTAVIYTMASGFWTIHAQLALGVVLCLTPWVLPGSLRATNGFEPLPFIGTISFLYFGGGALSVLADPNQLTGLDWPELTRALFWVNCGWAMCMVGYSLPVGRATAPVGDVQIQVRIDWTRVVPVMVIVGLACDAAFRLVPGSLTAILGIYSTLCPVALGFAAYLVAKRDGSPPGPWVETITYAAPAWVLLNLGAGQREPILLPFIYMAVGYRLGRAKPFPRWALLVAVLAGAVVIRALGDYKVALYSGASPITALGQMADTAISADPLEYLSDSVGATGARANYLGILATVIENTPDPQPFMNGETYTLFLWAMFVPRFLYPDKPTLGIYNDFAQRYGFVQEEDTSTSIALPPVCELYLNFGFVGIVVGMTVFGVLYRRLYTWAMAQSRVAGLPILVYIAMAYQLARGDIFAMMMGNVLKLVIGILLLVAIFGRVGRGPTEGRSVRGLPGGYY